MSLPLSRTSVWASGSACAAIRSPSLRSSAPRWVALIAGQAPPSNAALAAATARPTSTSVQRGISAWHHGRSLVSLPVVGQFVRLQRSGIHFEHGETLPNTRQRLQERHERTDDDDVFAWLDKRG